MHKPIPTQTPVGLMWPSSTERGHHGNGTPVPGQRSAAACASPTSTSIVVMASKRRALPQRGPPLNAAPPAAELNKGREVFLGWRREALRPERETGGIPCARAASFDHLVGAGKQRRRHRET